VAADGCLNFGGIIFVVVDLVGADEMSKAVLSLVSVAQNHIKS
jgi:hypothetical protein